MLAVYIILVGGMQIEAYLDNETLTTCKNESGYQWNASNASQFIGEYNGLFEPFISKNDLFTKTGSGQT
eukprot:COSAG06_NODE_809_length_12164_cov_17.936179_12_plen_69_part_00